MASVMIPRTGWPSAVSLPSPATSDSTEPARLLGLPNSDQKQVDPPIAGIPALDRGHSVGGQDAADVLLRLQLSVITPPESPDVDAPAMEWSPVVPEEGTPAPADSSVAPGTATGTVAADGFSLLHPPPLPTMTPHLKPPLSMDDKKEPDPKLLQRANHAVNYATSNTTGKRVETTPGPTRVKKPRKGQPMRSLPPSASMRARASSIGSNRAPSTSPGLGAYLGAARSTGEPIAYAWSTSSQISSDEQSPNPYHLAPAAMADYRRRLSEVSTAGYEPDRRTVSPERSVSEEWAPQQVPVVATISLGRDGAQFMSSPAAFAVYVDPDSSSEMDREESMEDLRVKMDQTFTFAAVDDIIRRGEQASLLFWNDRAYLKQRERSKSLGQRSSYDYEDEPPSPITRGRSVSTQSAALRAATPRKPRVKKAEPSIPRPAVTKVFRSSDPSFLGALPSPPKLSKEPVQIQTPRVSYDIENVEIKRIRKSEPHETYGAPQYTWNKGDPIKFGPEDEHFDVLTKDEVKLCETIRLLPKLYLFVKDTMLTYREQHGYFKKLEAKKWFRLDVNKTGKVYDWFAALNWIEVNP